MTGRVTLRVTSGPIAGRVFVFEGHDTFLFGRSPECHAELAPDDATASRHHFLLEVNPPTARLRDLGSLNGTHVNGVKHGGREAHETPEEAARRDWPQVDLCHGDQIRVGATMIDVAIEGEDGAAPAPPAPTPGDTPPEIGGWALGRLLGKGGMGAVYLARRREDGLTAALKIMLSQVVVSESARETFRREIEVTRSLRHPAIVELLDHGSLGERFYFAMEYCAGGSVQALMRARGGPLPLEMAGRIALGVLDGLAHAHELGFIHRDLKPENLVVGDAEGRGAKITDFGLAKSFEQAGLSGLTATGAVAGTLSFMPREQLVNFRLARPVSDVWSMGATLYFMLTSRLTRDFPPGQDPLGVILRGAIVPIRHRDPRIPEAVAEVVDRAVADDSAERFPTARAFSEALEAVL